jgi:hypothetical protein
MSNFAHCPTPDNDDDEEMQEEGNGLEEAYLEFKGEEEEYAPRTSINVLSRLSFLTLERQC